MNTEKNQETELKFSVDDFEYAKGVLRRLGATCVWSGNEETHYFDFANKKLSQQKTSLRLRVWPGHSNTITCKTHNKSKGKYKSLEELQVHIDDIDQMQRILERLGFEKTFSYTKKREHWMFEKTAIELDELGDGRRFVEIEGTPNSIEQLKIVLHLENAETSTKSYPEILKKK